MQETALETYHSYIIVTWGVYIANYVFQNFTADLEHAYSYMTVMGDHTPSCVATIYQTAPKSNKSTYSLLIHLE